jgi:hypothetical protein
VLSLQITLQYISVPALQHSSFFALCCWQLWKRRNAFILCNEVLSLRPCLVASEFQKIYKISRHIESLDVCMEH